MKTTTLKTIGVFIITLLIMPFSSSGQSYWQLGGNTDATPVALGLLATSNYFGGTQTASLQFGTGGTTYMFIGGSIIPAYNGFVGIGNGFVTPSHLLDVSGGDINVNTSTRGYMIGGQMVLWNGGNTSDIYGGVGAGNSGTGANSTALGYNALHNNMAAANTAVGYYALYTNTVGGGANTGIGAQALFLNLTGNSNTAVGWGAMYTNSTGAQNTAIGWSALS